MTHTLSFGTGPDVLVLKISQDAWDGDAQYRLSVDGVPVGDIAVAHAAHAAGEVDIVTLRGSFGPGRHTVTVDFLNDAYAGSPATDRNLHVEEITLNGQPVDGGAAVLFQAGPREFGFTGGQPPAQPVIGSGPDVFRLSARQDPYRLDDAAFTVSVDGRQIGGTLRVPPEGYLGPFEVRGEFGDQPSVLTVDFLNDAYGGAPGADRNLYVSVDSYNGAPVPNGRMALYASGPHSVNLRPVRGTPQDDALVGTEGNDRMFGEAGDDRLAGHGGRDEIRGGGGDDTLDGGAEDNRLHGDAGDDLLRAAGGYDIMDGGAGDDTLVGGAWADEMAGGPGTDRFLYSAAEDSARRNGDIILDLSRTDGDRIDLSAIDADTTQPGNQAFAFIGEQGAPGRGELGFSYVGLVLRNFLRGNTDDDPEPEIEILVDGRAPLVAGDIIL